MRYLNQRQWDAKIRFVCESMWQSTVNETRQSCFVDVLVGMCWEEKRDWGWWSLIKIQTSGGQVQLSKAKEHLGTFVISVEMLF